MKPRLRILVTGATGFIGGHLTRYLTARGHYVRALVRRPPPQDWRVFGGDASVELAWGDVTDPASVRAAVNGTSTRSRGAGGEAPPSLRGGWGGGAPPRIGGDGGGPVDAIFHLAAVRDVWGTPEAVYRQVNVEGTRCLLDAAAEAGVQRFVYCSSVGVARYPGNLEADEALPYSEPTSQVLYHRTKAEAERLALDAQAIVVRPVITYGPGDETGFVTRLIALLARGRFVWVGDGRNHVDLVYVDDLVAGMCAALERGAAGRVYILSGPAPIQVRALVDEICGLLGRQPPRVCIPTPVANLAGWGIEMFYRACNRVLPSASGGVGGMKEPFITRDKVATLTVDRGFSHARADRELGYRPRVDCDEGLRRTVMWLETTVLPFVRQERKRG